MDIPAQYAWPANELEEVLSASLGDPGATARLVEVLGRSEVWVPLPAGGGPDAPDLDLPTLELDGALYVPVFSSEPQFRHAVGAVSPAPGLSAQPPPGAPPGMACAVAPAREFARGLPPGVGIAVNPGGAVGIPLPPEAVARLCRTESSGVSGSGARVRLWEPEPGEEPVDFLAAAAGEFTVTPLVLSARRALASVEGESPMLFVGVELDSWQPEDRNVAMDALGRALGAVPVAWPVHLVLLDVAQDPVGDWMLARVRPFFGHDR